MKGAQKVKIYRFETNKICNVIFWIGNDPPPLPSGLFQRNIHILGDRRPLSSCHNDVVQVLLQHPQIDINKVDGFGDSALHWAVYAENHEGLAALLARRDELTTSINQRNNMGLTPIMNAVWCNSVNCFHLLLTNPLVDLDTRDNHQRTCQEVRR